MKTDYFIKVLTIPFWIILCATPAFCANSMFDNDGNYSGNWKQMTTVSSSSGNKTYSSSAYSTSTWYANNRKQREINNQTPYSAANYTQMSTTPFRYNTLNYTRIRKVKGGYGDYNAKCSDIGDASFCY